MQKKEGFHSQSHQEIRNTRPLWMREGETMLPKKKARTLNSIPNPMFDPQRGVMDSQAILENIKKIAGFREDQKLPDGIEKSGKTPIKATEKKEANKELQGAFIPKSPIQNEIRKIQADELDHGDLNSTKKSEKDSQTHNDQAQDILDIETSKNIEVFIEKVLRPSRISSKSNGFVKGYAANSNKGLIKQSNEDRICIIMKVVAPEDEDIGYWPNCSFFGVFDGHNGDGCANYLRDNLFQLIVSSPSFPSDTKSALEEGFQKAEEEVLKLEQDFSGSTANVIMIVDDQCFVANVGDSRSILSAFGGQATANLSVDHRPTKKSEMQRILRAGGKIYRNKFPGYQPEEFLEPARVLPGDLPVLSSSWLLHSFDFDPVGLIN